MDDDGKLADAMSTIANAACEAERLQHAKGTDRQRIDYLERAVAKLKEAAMLTNVVQQAMVDQIEKTDKAYRRLAKTVEAWTITEETR